MRLTSHDNLTVWSIRHDLFGPGRFDPQALHHASQPSAPSRHFPGPCRHADPVVIRVVEHPQAPQPADCHPCESHGTAVPSPGLFPAWLIYAPVLRSVWPWTMPSTSTHAPTMPAPVLAFRQDQPVPATGSLLDIWA